MVVLLVILLAILFNYSNVIGFLINYHIYCIYVMLIIIVFYTNYIFFLKYQYLYIYSYIYLYWFVYLNTIYLNMLILYNLHTYIYNFIIFKVLPRFNLIVLDTKNSFFDFFFYFSGFVSFLSKPNYRICKSS
jgi:hypothetical protein